MAQQQVVLLSVLMQDALEARIMSPDEAADLQEFLNLLQGEQQASHQIPQHLLPVMQRFRLFHEPTSSTRH